MTNFWTTIAHTAGRRIKSKAFIFATISMSLLVLVLVNINNIIDVFSNESSQEKDTIAVVDLTEENIGEFLESQTESRFEYILHLDGDVDSAIEEAVNNQYNYVLTVRGNLEEIEAEFYGSGNDFMIAQEVHQDVQRVKESLATNELGLSEQELALIYTPIVFDEFPLQEGGEVQTMESHMQSYWMVYALVFAIYIIVLTFGSMIATEVATEKSSRVMELLVSSINPVTQMLGKIVGIGIAGMVNLLVIAGAALIGTYISGEDTFRFLIDVIDISLIFYALTLILLGYFVYGGMAAMLGALVSRAEEVNQALQPVVFLAMIALFISIFGLNTPDATFIQVLSYVPFFTPQLLFLRIGMGTIPTWEVILIFLILLISAILITILAARVYKGGVLMYGKFSFKEGMKQAFTLGKKES
ncbi:ABC transporter permease [Evansella sp. AB-rgal1]|uniref:ABC transporter permease n=1 Tax=Evansella sp. AB-rgal1 TaxID=3242696 RepID=UPI00359E72B1